jgi:hypothetical protein
VDRAAAVAEVLDLVRQEKPGATTSRLGRAADGGEEHPLAAARETS